MKRKNSRLQVFLEKYNQDISKSARGKHSKSFYMLTVFLGCGILLSLIVNVWSSKPPIPLQTLPSTSERINVTYDDYPEPGASQKETKMPVADTGSALKKERDTEQIKTGSSLLKLPSTKTVQHKIKAGESLWSIFKKNNLSSSFMYELVNASKGVYNLNRLRKGELYKFTFENNKFKNFALEVKGEKILTITKGADGFAASLDPIKYEIKKTSISTAVKSSLFETVKKIGENYNLAFKLTNIFAWQIDFFLDIRKGDHLKVMVEKKYRNGKFIKYGKVLSAEITNKGKKYQAILFVDSKNREDYYDSKGRSLRKQFLKSPLVYTRISSGFTKRRFHPILKRYQPHLGIDYAAPIGTPVKAIGDGKVIWAGRKGPNGNLVMIKHNGIYSTTYAHLSRYGRGIKKHVTVRQGQIIGYVGSTGRSTGPHLDFHLKKYGKSINPLKLKIPSAASVRKRDKKRFNSIKNEMIALLDNMDEKIIIADNEPTGMSVSSENVLNKYYH